MGSAARLVEDRPGRGIGFYTFIKGPVLKSMDEGLGQLVGIKEDKERKLGSWDEIAKVAQRLHDDFHRIVDAEIFKNTIRRIDERGCMRFPDGTKITHRRDSRPSLSGTLCGS